MSATTKGIIGTVLGLLGLFPAVWVDALDIQPILFIAIILPLVFSLLAVYLGIKARKGESRISGMASLTLGIIATLSHILNIRSFFISFF